MAPVCDAVPPTPRYLDVTPLAPGAVREPGHLRKERRLGLVDDLARRRSRSTEWGDRRQEMSRVFAATSCFIRSESPGEFPWLPGMRTRPSKKRQTFDNKLLARSDGCGYKLGAEST